MNSLVHYTDPHYWDVMDLAFTTFSQYNHELPNTLCMDQHIQDVIQSYSSDKCKLFLIKYDLYRQKALEVQESLISKYEELFFCLTLYYTLDIIDNQQYGQYRYNLCMNFYQEYYNSPVLQQRWKNMLSIFDTSLLTNKIDNI